MIEVEYIALSSCIWLILYALIWWSLYTGHWILCYLLPIYIYIIIYIYILFYTKNTAWLSTYYTRSIFYEVTVDSPLFVKVSFIIIFLFFHSVIGKVSFKQASFLQVICFSFSFFFSLCNEWNWSITFHFIFLLRQSTYIAIVVLFLLHIQQIFLIFLVKITQNSRFSFRCCRHVPGLGGTFLVGLWQSRPTF